MLVFTMGCGGSVIFVYTDGDQSVVFIPDVDDGQAPGLSDDIRVFPS